MDQQTLPYLIYGNAIVNQVAVPDPDILGYTAQIETSLVNNLASLPLAPMPSAGVLTSQSFALLPVGGSLVFVRVHNQQPDQALPIYELIELPADVQQWGYRDLQALFDRLEQAITASAVTYALLDPIEADLHSGSSVSKTTTLLSALYSAAEEDMPRILYLLDSILSGQVVLQHTPQNWQYRLQIVRGLLQLMPPISRPHLTFTSYTPTLSGDLPRLIFHSDTSDDFEATFIDWRNGVPDDWQPRTAYVRYLQGIWHSDLDALATTLYQMYPIAAALMPGQPLLDGLALVVRRHELDRDVLRGVSIRSTDELLRVVTGDHPPENGLRLRYSELLLRRALQERHPAGAAYLGQEMADNALLDDQLQAIMHDALSNQPDALYAFLRTYMADTDEPQQKWLSRLHDAAEASLTIALEGGDPDTMAGWLRLLAREPQRYQLGDVLRQGILAALPLSHNHQGLAEEVLRTAFKRQTDMLATIFADDAWKNSLSELWRQALVDCDADSIEQLGSESREAFLLAVSRVIDAGQAAITPAIIRQLWQIEASQKTATLPPLYRPVAIIQRLIRTPQTMQEGALESLITLMIRDDQISFLMEVLPILTTHVDLSSIVAQALLQSGSDIESMLSLINRLNNEGLLTPQQALDAYSGVLLNQKGIEGNRAILEQISRNLTQYPETTVTTPILWRLVELSGELKSEQMLRTSERRIIAMIENQVSEVAVIEDVLHLRRASAWHANGKANLMRWWRDYLRKQGLGALQRLDRGLESQKNTDDLRHSIQTSMAMRKVLGSRTLSELADDIRTTYNLLQALSEGFDVAGRNTAIDSATIRTELSARGDELAPDARAVLATNLKELAQLITTLSENRSKGVIRSEESIERQLLSGEQQPQSALDVMRWLSGYLEGAQRATEPDNTD